MGERILQRVVMPPRRGLTRLYCRFNRARTATEARPRMRGRRSLLLPRGRTMRTDTWFNAFFESYWRQYTHLQQLTLRIQVTGVGVLRLYRRGADGKQTVLHECDFSGTKRELDLEISARAVATDKPGLLFFEIETRSPRLALHQAQWLTHQETMRPTRLVAAYCTFNRAAALLPNLAALFTDPEVVQILDRVIVVDQGHKKVREHPAYESLMQATGDRLQLVEQDNHGGAGGFTRCLLEAQQAGTATHIVLMDDDALGEPESLLRTAAFFSLAHSDLAIGGAMFEESRPCQLVASGNMYLPEQLRIDEPRKQRVDRARDLQSFLPPRHVHYNGWWFFAFPLAILDRVGLPLPLFLRGDDLEFGCRLFRSAIPTILLPGLGVWHESLESKGRSWHPFYEMRNQFLVGALHFPGVGALNLARRFFSRLLDELLAYDYYQAWLYCEAARAYLRGPAALHHSPLPLQHALQAMQSKLPPQMQTCADTPRMPLRRPPALSSGAARLWRWWLVLRNCVRASPAPQVQPQFVLQGTGEQWYDIGSVEIVGVEELHRQQVVILRRSRSLFVRLFLRGIRLALELCLRHRFTERRWRTGVSELMSRSFWTELLRMPPVCAVREEALCIRD